MKSYHENPSIKRTLKRYVLPLLLCILFVVPVTVSAHNNETETTLQEVITMTGTITDDATGDPLAGVSIQVKGTLKGTITGLDGSYSIEVNPGDILVFSYMGYLEQEITVTSQSNIDVSMKEDVIGLDEVIVTGYAVVKKSNLTGAVASVSGDDLTKIPAHGVEQALQGRAAGVYVSSNTGAPGSDMVVQIRGITSVNGANPLYIIDGLNAGPAEVNSLNPADIESIEVLKDASSAAIYGASGGTGVIIITTKKGTSGKTVVNFDSYFGQQSVWKKMDMVNTSEFVQIYNELNPESDMFEDISGIPDTDWQDEVTRKAWMQNYNLAISGGSDISTFRLSGNYFKQEGIVEKSDYERFSFTLNSEHKLSDRITIGENMTISNKQWLGYEEWELRNMFYSPFTAAVQAYPFIEPYDENGDWGQSEYLSSSNNPRLAIDLMDKKRTEKKVLGNVYANVNLIKGLTYQTRFGGNFTLSDYKNFDRTYRYNSVAFNDLSSVEERMRQDYSWTWYHTLTYKKSISNHNIQLLAGQEASQYKGRNLEVVGNNLLRESSDFQYIDAADPDTTIVMRGGADETRGFSYFGRINYDFAGKYLAEFNLRRDASSKFGPEHRTGMFPSVSLGWKFSEESFMDNLPFISFGKLRYSYGEVGNNQILDFVYLPTTESWQSLGYAFDGVEGTQGFAPDGIPNYDVHWESVVATNYGIDLSFLDNRINLSVDYFKKYNDGMLIVTTLPRSVGMYVRDTYVEGQPGDPTINAGRVDNKGVEISLGLKNVSGAVRQSLDFNITFLKNEIINFGGDTLIDGDQHNLQSFTITTEGVAIGSFYGYKIERIFRPEDAEMIDGALVVTNQPYTINEDDEIVYAQRFAQPGDVKFADLNGDGMITRDDRTVIGNPYPDMFLGVSYALEFKNLDFNMFWQASIGNDILNVQKQYFFRPSGDNNWSRDMLDRYRTPVTDGEGNIIDPGNTTSDQFKVDGSASLNQNSSRMSDWYVEDGSYLRLKNIQVGYSLPKNIVSRVGMSNLRFYIGAKNLFTFTKYSGMDPEVGGAKDGETQKVDPIDHGVDVGAYPQSRIFLLGVNASF